MDRIGRSGSPEYAINRADLAVKLDGPSFPASIYAALVESEEPGSYSLI